MQPTHPPTHKEHMSQLNREKGTDILGGGVGEGLYTYTVQ